MTMKSILSKLTAMSMVATTATADALQWSSLLRGSEVQVDTSIQQTDCEDGWYAGVDAVDDMWKKKPFYSDCDNVWQLSDEAEDLKDDEFPDDDDTDWRTSTYNECARNGVDSEVTAIEKECLWDDSSQCTDLGNSAAEIVVMDNWCTHGKLKQLQDECEDQVNDMVGTDDDDDDEDDDTDRDLDDCGRDGSCGSCKKAYCPDVTERQQCKEDHCSMEDLLLFFPEDVEAHAIN
eukprot:CAMPEP_0184440330 /NCGR_PEP_ID=MMETSP0738-20130409/755508_1 /TAXON_ID=385413 /ORGANISM="Thalassiosira miniscula, Strain CCMP1093" /LENGTH=233 /DNA_ID=CAMNT_0026808213 /DNA_START=218 /DNA_END=919 /DNA_ORIENTATION=-